jgi:hypothetical protein
VSVKALPQRDDLLEGDAADQHPIAIALRRQDNVDDARVTKNETLVRRGKKWFRYGAPDKRLFKQLQKTLIVFARALLVCKAGTTFEAEELVGKKSL